MHGMQEVWGSNPHWSIGENMAQAVVTIKPEYLKEMEKYTKKCGFIVEEKNFILGLTSIGISPGRVIATIALNTQKEKDIWVIMDETLKSYSIAITHNTGQLKKAEKKKENANWLEKKVLDKEIEFHKLELKKNQNISKILEEAQGRDSLIAKIKEKSGFKTEDELR